MGLQDREITERMLAEPEKHFGPVSINEIKARFPVLWGEVDADRVNWLTTFQNNYIFLATRAYSVARESRDVELSITSLEEAYHRTVRAILA